MEQISKICTSCKNEVLLIDFYKDKTHTDGYQSVCKICVLEKRKNYRINNLDKIRNWNKEYEANNKDKAIIRSQKWYDNNTEKAIERTREWKKNNKEKRNEQQSKHRAKNPHIYAWRGVLKDSLKRLGKKKEAKTIDLLGYSASDLKNHITVLFTEGMSWDNYGEWHIDHIKTVSEFDKDSLPSIVNALSNLRPLWATTRVINGIIYEGNLNRNKIYRQ